jgi:hypothetical protein
MNCVAPQSAHHPTEHRPSPALEGADARETGSAAG